jgi:hypothetical protein
VKKPDYFNIRIPRVKGTFSPAVKKYFKSLEGKVLDIRFYKERQRKVFKYKVLSSGAREMFNYWKNEKPERYLEVELEAFNENLDGIKKEVEDN